MHRLSCHLKAKPGLSTQKQLICLANSTESNLDEKTLSSRFVQLLGPEVSEFISTDGMAEWDNFVCKHVEITLQMAPFDWKQFISLLGREGFTKFLLCLHDEFDELKYQEVCRFTRNGIRVQLINDILMWNDGSLPIDCRFSHQRVHDSEIRTEF